MLERECYMRKEEKQPEKARVHIAERTAGHDNGYTSAEDEAISQSVDQLVGQLADAAIDYIRYSSLEPLRKGGRSPTPEKACRIADAVKHQLTGALRNRIVGDERMEEHRPDVQQFRSVSE